MKEKTSSDWEGSFGGIQIVRQKWDRTAGRVKDPGDSLEDAGVVDERVGEEDNRVVGWGQRWIFELVVIQKCDTVVMILLKSD